MAAQHLSIQTDWKGLERLLRYCARSIFAGERPVWAQLADTEHQNWRCMPAEDAAFPSPNRRTGNARKAES